MTTFVHRPGHPLANEFGMVDRDLAGAPPTKSGRGPRVYVVGDEMPATKHMATGEYFTSKAKFRQRTRDVGCVEVGNDAAITRPRKAITLDRAQRVEAIKRSIAQLQAR